MSRLPQGPGHACLGPTGTSETRQLPVAAQGRQGCKMKGTGAHACHPNQPSHPFHGFVSANYPSAPCQEGRSQPSSAAPRVAPLPGGTSRHPLPLLQKAFAPTPQFWFGRVPSCRCPLLMPPFMLEICYWWEEKAQLLRQRTIPTVRWLNWSNARVPCGHQPG